MKLTVEDDKKKTVLDDNASIYAKRDNRRDIDKFKDLNGKEKWQFFKDYWLKWVIIGIITIAVCGSFLYSILKEKPEVKYEVLILDNPLSDQYLEEFKADINNLFVTDPEHSETVVDADYYVSQDDYNARMKLMAVIAAKEVDAIIMSYDELQTQVNGGCAGEIKEYLSPELYNELKDYMVEVTPYETDINNNPVPGEAAVYAIDVTTWLNRVYKTEVNCRYVAICVCNTQHPESFEAFVRYLFDK